MRRSVAIGVAGLLVCLGVAAAAQANTIPAGSYDLGDVTVDGFQLTGSVALNASGIISGADITLHDAALNNPTFTQVNSAGGPSGYAPVADYAYVADPGVGQLALYYLTAPDSSGDVDVCILSAGDCNSYQASYMQIYGQSSFGYNLVDLNSGALDPTAASAPTPEPGSLALLGTGILVLAHMTKKRKRWG